MGAQVSDESHHRRGHKGPCGSRSRDFEPVFNGRQPVGRAQQGLQRRNGEKIGWGREGGVRLGSPPPLVRVKRGERPQVDALVEGMRAINIRRLPPRSVPNPSPAVPPRRLGIHGMHGIHGIHGPQSPRHLQGPHNPHGPRSPHLPHNPYGGYEVHGYEDDEDDEEHDHIHGIYGGYDGEDMPHGYPIPHRRVPVQFPQLDEDDFSDDHHYAYPHPHPNPHLQPRPYLRSPHHYPPSPNIPPDDLPRQPRFHPGNYSPLPHAYELFPSLRPAMYPPHPEDQPQLHPRPRLRGPSQEVQSPPLNPRSRNPNQSQPRNNYRPPYIEDYESSQGAREAYEEHQADIEEMMERGGKGRGRPWYGGYGYEDVNEEEEGEGGERDGDGMGYDEHGNPRPGRF